MTTCSGRRRGGRDRIAAILVTVARLVPLPRGDQDGLARMITCSGRRRGGRDRIAAILIIVARLVPLPRGDQDGLAGVITCSGRRCGGRSRFAAILIIVARLVPLPRGDQDGLAGVITCSGRQRGGRDRIGAILIIVARLVPLPRGDWDGTAVVIACLVVMAGLIIAWRPGRPGGIDPGCRPSCRPRCGLGVIGVAGRPRTGWPGGTCVHSRRPGGPGSVASGLAWLGSQRGPSVRSRICHHLSRQQRRPSFPRVHAPAPPEAATAGCRDPKNSRTRSDLHFHRTGETRRSYYRPDVPLTATPAAGWYTTLCRLRSGPAAFAAPGWPDNA